MFWAPLSDPDDPTVDHMNHSTHKAQVLGFWKQYVYGSGEMESLEGAKALSYDLQKKSISL